MSSSSSSSSSSWLGSLCRLSQTVHRSNKNEASLADAGGGANARFNGGRVCLKLYTLPHVPVTPSLAYYFVNHHQPIHPPFYSLPTSHLYPQCLSHLLFVFKKKKSYPMIDEFRFFKGASFSSHVQVLQSIVRTTSIIRPQTAERIATGTQLVILLPVLERVHAIYVRVSVTAPVQPHDGNDWMTEESWFDSLRNKRYFSYPKRSDRLWNLLNVLFIWHVS